MIEEHERKEEERKQAEFYRRLGVDGEGNTDVNKKRASNNEGEEDDEGEEADVEDDVSSVDSLKEEEERRKREGVDRDREEASRSGSFFLVVKKASTYIEPIATKT